MVVAMAAEMDFWFKSCALAGRLMTQADTTETANKARIEILPLSPRQRGGVQAYVIACAA
jgi:Asp/Glu/hydantoin racemase